MIKDLTDGKPMDRLVCGDVGFGKTEVALRAAFVALADGAQVAVLVPTTLLAEQHFQVFSDRFAELPVKLVELSRFRSSKEVKAALEGLAAGKIDLVIGTHKLIQSDVKFKNLGLVIIDEEHRFGVRQKEQLKKLRAEVDVLTLTATPIPRTLAMSLEGIRDFSVIATAPQRRLAIKTFVSVYSRGIIREAVLRELKRGGQIYFLHNDIQTINTTAERLAQLLPEARIAIAHGQMGERDLEHVMREFYAQRVNLLLCSTIIESGIDVPTANTIIIERADHFGLAQLHQLRGRVGRSHHQAYAYLLTPPEEALSVQAKKRLEAIQMMEDLGAGFFLAMHDLEIRGAGEVLGESQSGEMQEVGFQLYADMLRSAVSALKAGREPDLSAPLGVATEINLHVPTLLPANYCSDVHERLVLYKRFANCETAIELERDAGGAGRPLRHPAGACAGADRLSPAASRREAEGRRQGRRRPRAHDAAIRQGAAVRPGVADHDHQERRPCPLRRSGSRAHRARRADACRPRCAGPGVPREARVNRLASRESVSRANPRLRPRLAVVEQHPAQEPRRPRADRLGLHAARAADARAVAFRAWPGRCAARSPRQHALPRGPRRRQRGDRPRNTVVPSPCPRRRRRWWSAGTARRCSTTIATSASSASASIARLPPDTTHVWGDLEWQALAAPGHDMGALVFYNAEHRILISGDALWENGFGFLMPPEIDPLALPATRATLDMLARLDVRIVIPGHGEPFAGVSAALDRADRRLAAFEADGLRVARHALKVNLMFNLLDLQRMALADLPDYMERVGLYRDFNACYFRVPPAELAEMLVRELQRSGAAKVVDGWLTPVGGLISIEWRACRSGVRVLQEYARFIRCSPLDSSLTMRSLFTLAIDTVDTTAATGAARRSC